MMLKIVVPARPVAFRLSTVEFFLGLLYRELVTDQRHLRVIDTFKIYCRNNNMNFL